MATYQYPDPATIDEALAKLFAERDRAVEALHAAEEKLRRITRTITETEKKLIAAFKERQRSQT